MPESMSVERRNLMAAYGAEFEFTRRVAREEGILAGISTGASLAAVNKKIRELKPGVKILTFCYDTGERYLSVEDLFSAPL